MGAINITRFVDINILQHATSAVNATRDTTILFTNEEINKLDSETGKKGSVAAKVDEEVGTFASYEQWSEANYGNETEPHTDAFVKVYFDNGGNKIKIIKTDDSNFEASVKKLKNEEIVVAYANTNPENAYSTIKGCASSRNSDSEVYGINQKILLCRYTTSDQIGDDSTKNENSGIQNLCAKYSTIEGAEMTMAAYLSNIDCYGINTIKDYAYTIENITETKDDATTAGVATTGGLDELVGYAINNNFNIDVYLAGAVRNVGGNLTNGLDLVNQFTLIVLHQTLTDRLLNLLTTKLKGSSGISSIYTTIASELNRYLTNGYLTTDKVWRDGNYSINVNGTNYLLIPNNTPLNSGYHISVLPFSSLTDEERERKECPLIYVFIADSYGIRKITVNGEVI